jgi:hypothetical protein
MVGNIAFDMCRIESHRNKCDEVLRR